MRLHRGAQADDEQGGVRRLRQELHLQVHGDEGHHILFVCPKNKLANNYKEHGCTINKFFGVGLTEGANMPKFYDSACDSIVFEETFFCSARNLARIKRYCEKQPRQKSS